jgi:hypothetical protein
VVRHVAGDRWQANVVVPLDPIFKNETSKR